MEMFHTETIWLFVACYGNLIC